MENKVFKSVAFGGFDKQDVVAYIEKAAREAAEAQEQLRRENDGLREESQALGGRLAELEEEKSRLLAELEQASAVRQELEEEKSRLLAELEQASAVRQELESLRPEAERLSAESETLRADAEAYAHFRDQIGTIECDARRRAADLEEETGERMRQAAERFRAQYQALMNNFEAAASHVSSELRKIEVSLTQLPRAMDRSGADLKELESLLGRRDRES